MFVNTLFCKYSCQQLVISWSLRLLIWRHGLIFNLNWNWHLKETTEPFVIYAKISNLNYLISWFWMTLTWHVLTNLSSLRGYLEMSQTRSLPTLGFIQAWYSCYARQNQPGKTVKYLAFDLISDVIWVPLVNFAETSNTIWIIPVDAKDSQK